VRLGVHSSSIAWKRSPLAERDGFEEVRPIPSVDEASTLGWLAKRRLLKGWSIGDPCQVGQRGEARLGLSRPAPWRQPPHTTTYLNTKGFMQNQMEYTLLDLLA